MRRSAMAGFDIAWHDVAMSTKPALKMATAMALSGTVGWFVIVSSMPTPELVFWRSLIGAGVLVVVALARGMFATRLPWRVVALAAAGGVAIVLNWMLLFEAYGRASLSVSTVVYNTQPFILAGLAAALGWERPTRESLAWLAAAFGGLILVAAFQDGGGAAGRTYASGIGLALGAAFFWAVGALVAKRLAGTPPLLVVLIQLIVGAVLTAPLAVMSHRAGTTIRWDLLAVIGVVHTGLVFVLMYDAVQKLPTTAQGALSFLYPVVATLVDVTALGHRLHPVQLAGMALITVAAVGLNIRRGATRGQALSAPERLAPTPSERLVES